jgi:hypothetical protein
LQRRQDGEEPSQPKRMNRAEEPRDEGDGAKEAKLQRRQDGEEPSQPKRMNQRRSRGTKATERL